MLKPGHDRDGYVVVTLCDSGRTKTVKVSRLVCSAFNGLHPIDQDICRHLDGDQSNNTPENLAWGTHQDNADDRVTHGTTLAGQDAPNAVFTQSQVNDLRTLYHKHMNHRLNNGYTRARRQFIADLAEQHGVSVHTLNTVIRKGYGL